MEDSPRTRQDNRFPLRLGFVPLSDCAPIAVAREMGIFDRYGLNVTLSRELGWASVRDKIYYGDLDAAQSIAGIAFALGLGFSELRCEVAVPLILNLHGNAVTLSTSLKHSEIGQGEGLKAHLMHSWKRDRPFTLAATHRYSSHHILLHTWLRRHGLASPEDAEIIFLPPPLMPRHLKAGHIDGYCVGEPWNSEAILDGTGWCPVTSAELSHGHPEKVLLISGRFLRERRDDSIGLVAALLESCRLCQDPAFLEDLIAILAMEEYTGASRDVLRNSLSGRFMTGHETINGSSFHIFHGESVNRPTVEKASWVLAGLRTIGALPEITAGSLSRIYREDIFHEAQHCCQRA
jgi:ABC-type nitrate/sulfonate/bicarbonate transport system substrate-binding protein